MTRSQLGPEIRVSINGADPLPVESFDVHQERIDVSTATASKPDMSWTFVDGQGHFHAYDHEGKLPTVVHREEYVRPDPAWSEAPVDPDEYDDAEFGYSVLHIECALCGEAIEPKRVPDNPQRTIPGRTEYRLTVHGWLPEADRFSVLFTVKDKAFFGFGQSVAMAWRETGPVHEVVCGPLSWRPAPMPSQVEPEPNLWAGLRERTERRP